MFCAPVDIAGSVPVPLATAREWLSGAERIPPFLSREHTLFTAIEMFQSDLDLRVVPVVDSAHRPLGAIFEKDVRRLLLNPFGHALMRNPAYGNGLAAHMRPCPSAEVDHGIDAILSAYREAHGTEGMVLTHQGRLFATLSNRRLVHLSATQEVAHSRRQLERTRRIETAASRFEARAIPLARTLAALSQHIGDNARATQMQAGDTGDRAATAATAAAQTRVSMEGVAAQGRALANAFSTISTDAIRAKSTAAAAVSMVGDGSARMRELRRSAQSIDEVIALIGGIAQQVNLLALNATIEAARAGESGRGFTVVANEVKQLANQAGAAAGRITAHVEEICEGIARVSDGHVHVEQAIGAMARLSDTVEDALGTQRETTELIATAVEETVAAGAQIASDVEAIGGTAHLASDSAREMGSLADRLHGEAVALDAEVQSLLAELRAA